MTGIQFITDEKGRKTAAVIDLKKHKALWEEIEDGLISESRRKEKGIPYGAIPRRPPQAHALPCLSTL